MLADILPAEAVTLTGDSEIVLDHLGAPECVVRPASAEEVATVMAWASREGVGVLPIRSGRRTAPAGGTGRDGAPWIVLSVERLNGIEIYEAADLTLTAGAGTPLRELDGALRANGQWAPFDPPHVLTRSLGGLVADGASGPLATGYGELRNHVLGMTVVTGDGRVLRLGGRVVKNVAGFDLIKPMTGSRGSLAVMTSVCLRTFPVPQEDRVLLLSAGAVADLVGAAVAVGTAPVLPVSSFMIDRLDEAGGAAALIVRLHGARAAVDADQRTIEQHVGRVFDVVDDGRRTSVLEQGRDHATGSSVTVLASASPSRLAELIAAIEATGTVSLAVDPYSSLARVGLDGVEADALGTLTERVGAIGGAVRVDGGTDPSLRQAGSRPTPDEARIVQRLRAAFDPEGVLWPARA
jgi:glycolate oxidase FAD binding subunit